MGKLKNAEDRLEAFKKQHNVTSLDEERRLLLSEEGALRTELNRTLSQVAETENRMVQIQRQLADTPKTVPMEEEVEHSPYVINTLQARLMELELKQKELLLKYSEESRWVKNVIEEIKMVKEKLTEQETKRYGKSRSGVNTTHQRLQEELYRNQAEMKALKAKEETQTSQLVYHRERLGKLNGIEVELKGLQRQVDVDQQNYRLYLMKFEESRISDAMDTEKMTSVTQIEPATRPLKPVSPKVMQNLILGILLGALGGFGLAFLMEYLDESMEKPEDVEAALNLPVLASIPVEIVPKDLGVASGRWSLGSRYYLGAGLGLAPCAIVGLVLLGGESFFGQKENAAFPGLDRFQATITDQPGIVKKSLGLTPPDAHALQEVSGPAQPQSADSSKPVKIPDEPNSENQTRDMSAGPKNQLHASATNPVSLQKPDLQISEKTLQPSRLIDETSKVEGLSIQLGAFREESSANEVMKKLQTLGYSPHLDMRPLKNQSLIRRVLLKGFASISEAGATMDRLKKQGFPDVFIPQPDRNLQRTASAANPVPLPGPSFQIAQKPAQPSPSIPETPKMGELSIQLGAFREESSAHDVMRKLQEIGYNPRLDTKTMKNQALIHRVRLKGYASRIEAGAIVVQLKKQGFPDVFIPQPEAN